jgi:hypothetical protein
MGAAIEHELRKVALAPIGVLKPVYGILAIARLFCPVALFTDMIRAA